MATADDAAALAALVFNEALLDTDRGDGRKGLERKEVAEILSVSVSLVDKWCSPTEKASPTIAQTFCMPLAFQMAHFRAMNRRFKLGRAAIVRVLDALGEFALGVD